MAWLKALEMPAHARLLLDSELRQIAAVDAELAADRHRAGGDRQDERGPSC